MRKVVISFLVNGFMLLSIGACQILEVQKDIAVETPMFVPERSNQIELENIENGNIVITTSKFSGVIVAKELAGISTDGKREYWTPTVDHILSMEEKIEPYLSENSSKFNSREAPIGDRLSRYNRQYRGFVENGVTMIVGFYFCSSKWEEDVWKKSLVDARGGGDCFFHVEYDVNNGAFRNIWVNAPL